MSTAKWAKPEYIKKMMRAAKSGKVRFAFTTGKQGDLLMMDDALEPKKLLANAKSESGNSKGCAGEAWLDGSCLMLQSESAISGLKKKFIALAKENELAVKTCKVLGSDGQEIGEEGASNSTKEDEWSPPEGPTVPGVSLGAAGLDPRFNLPTPNLADVAGGINQQVQGTAKEVEKALPKELQDLRLTYEMMKPFVMKASVAELVADIRSRFPNAPIGPDLLKFAQKLKVELGGGFDPANVAKAMLDPQKAIQDALQAEFLANLPSSVKMKFSGGVITLTKDGAALDTSVAGADIDAVAGPDGLKLNLKKGGAVIRVENSSLTQFDPKLRATFSSIEKDAKTVGELDANLNKLKLKIDDERKAGKTTINLDADFKKLEGELSLKRKTLNSNIEAVVKASTEGVVASLKQIREETKDRKAGMELEVSTKEMVAKFKAWKQTPDLKAALDIVATGKSISAKLEIEAAKTGTIVTADFEASLNNLKANLALVADKGNTKVSVDLLKKANDITASLEIVRKTKDLKLAAQLETDFQSVRGKLEAEVKAGNLTAKANLTGDSGKGTLGGSIGIEAVLAKGLTIPAVGTGNLNFKANVSDKGYSVGLSFSIGDPPDVASIKGLFDDADAGIKKVYELARDPQIRSIQDAQKAAEEVSSALKPVTSAVAKMKAMDKQKFSMALNVGLEGGWPVGGKVSPPIPTLGFTVRF